jgi:hypothetical protein
MLYSGHTSNHLEHSEPLTGGIGNRGGCDRIVQELFPLHRAIFIATSAKSPLSATIML